MLELGHPINTWRWTWQNGLKDAATVEKAGGKAIVPIWDKKLRFYGGIYLSLNIDTSCQTKQYYVHILI